MKLLFTFFSALCFLTYSNASTANNQDFFPSVLYQLDQHFSHHVFVIEKSTHSLFLYQFDKKAPKLLKKFKIMTGKFTGNKKLQGDKKTPEGVYFFQQFLTSQELFKRYGDYAKIYGAGAFTTNYPNEIDRRSGKTGGGIWLHSTDDDKRISLGLDSRGCVVAADQDLREMSKYIDLKNTPTIIVQDLLFQTKETWEKNKKEISTFVSKWANSWKEKSFKPYIESYSKKEFSHPRKGSYNSFKAYKKSVFSRKDSPSIEFSYTSILAHKDYVVVTMLQDYNSPIIQDIGKKTLYLKKNDNYEWKIIAEEWSHIDEEKNMAFTPRTQYFTNRLNQKVNTNDSESI